MTYIDPEFGFRSFFYVRILRKEEKTSYSSCFFSGDDHIEIRQTLCKHYREQEPKSRPLDKHDRNARTCRAMQEIRFAASLNGFEGRWNWRVRWIACIGLSTCPEPSCYRPLRTSNSTSMKRTAP